MQDENEIKKQLMRKIRYDEIKMKSRWHFAAKKIGLQSGLVLTIIVLAFSVNLFLYYVKANNLIMPLHYGPSIFQKILHSLPYDLTLAILALFLVLNFLIKRFDFSFKLPFAVMFSLFIIFVIFMALAVFTSNLNSLLIEGIRRSEMNFPFFSEFYLERCEDNLCDNEDSCRETPNSENTKIYDY